MKAGEAKQAPYQAFFFGAPGIHYFLSHLIVGILCLRAIMLLYDTTILILGFEKNFTNSINNKKD